MCDLSLRIGVAFLVAAASIGPGEAREAPAAAACASPESGLAGALTAWAKPAAAASTAHGAKDLAAARLTLNERVRLALAKRDAIAFIHAPEETKMPQQYVYAGLASFRVPKDGVYAVAIGEGMWIDVVQNGALVKSAAFGHGPDCSTIGKKVEFPLKAGEAVLQLSGAPYETADVLIVPVP